MNGNFFRAALWIAVSIGLSTVPSMRRSPGRLSRSRSRSAAERKRLVPQSHRLLPPRRTAGARLVPARAGRQTDPHSPRHVRPHGTTADAGRSGSFLTDRGPTPMNVWSSACWPVRATANAGAAIGSTWCAYADTGGFENDLRYPNAWKYRDSSSAPSMPISRSIASSKSKWPATSCGRTMPMPCWRRRCTASGRCCRNRR